MERLLAFDGNASVELSPPLAGGNDKASAPREDEEEGSGEISSETAAEASGERSDVSPPAGLEAMDTSQDSMAAALDVARDEPSEPGELALLPPDTAEVSLSDVEEVVEEPATDQLAVAVAMQEAPAADVLQEDSIGSSTISSAMGEKSLVEPAPRRRFPILLAGGAGVTLAACAAIVLLVIYSGWHEGEVPRGASPAESLATAADDNEQVVRTIDVKLQVSPPGAIITLDGKRRNDNPLVLQPSSRMHVLRVEAEGHEPLEHSFMARTDDTIVVTLNKRSATKDGATKAAKPRASAARPTPAAKANAPRPATRPVTRKPARPTPRPTKKAKKPVWIYDDL